MEPNKEDNVSVPITQITAAPDLQDASSLPSVSGMPPVVPPSLTPPMIPHPPVARPPTFRPPVSQNGGAKTSDTNSESEDEHYEISEESKQVRERQEKALQELLLKRRVAALAVPTNDRAVTSTVLQRTIPPSIHAKWLPAPR